MTAEARAKVAAERARLRTDFPFAVQMVAELSIKQDTWPKHPQFKPRVVWMKEGDKSWSR